MSATRRTFARLAGIVLVLTTTLAGSIALAHDGHEHGEATPNAMLDSGHGGHAMATPGVTDPGLASTGTGVVYLTITNDGDTDETLLEASTDRSERVVIHETVVENEVGRMLPVDGPLAVPAGETVTFESGGLHMMLVNLTDDIRLGDAFEVTLRFEHVGEVVVPVTAALDAEDAMGEAVPVGDITIEGVWSRPAPKIDGVSGTPVATPASQN